MSKEAMKLALEALEDNFDMWTAKTKAITAIKEALAEQPAQQEPVAWTLTAELEKRETTTRARLWFSDPVNCMWTPLYTTPQQAQRTWVGLTEGDLDKLACGGLFTNRQNLARAVEAKLRSKNT